MSGAPSTLLVLINRDSGLPGAAPVEHRLRELFAAESLDAELRVVERGEDIAELARAAVGRYAALVVAGGDGSLSAAAGALAGTDMPLGILPLGTFNHFARDLGLPIDLERAIRVLAAGKRRRVDVGEVNGRVFVNNSSVGIYTDVVEDRDRQRRGTGRRKTVAAAIAGFRALARYRRQRLTVSVGGQVWRKRTSLLFVGNNSYRLSFPNLSGRTRLDGGELCLFAVTGHGWRLVRLMLRTLLGHADADADFQRVEGIDGLTIDSDAPSLVVALDGEVATLATPLTYRSRPTALTVIAP
ncbi:diacylglycerol/lipid kinase family protein [Sphingoaurantiacus capsulatus]|uniref:Diacylglycerol/lipid kinase family protein n=1 Tax=Sphingoaurantiacus capsulatus TaxID=1771310 RepID=A0ABV7X6V1_9SPHN